MGDTHLLGAVIEQALRQFSAERHGGLLDSQLLERFAANRDAAAFETLVWRHGPMVLATCRRILHQTQDAEDAFQATFLVFCRKVRSIRKVPSCGAWLYKVAYRIALRARANDAKRSAAEKQFPTRPTSTRADDVLWRDLRPVLDDELNRLPEKYRVVLVLHYLEGKTVAQAAAELCWRPGTVSGRLARAKNLLRSRLTRRGLGMAIAAPLTSVLSQHASAGGLPAGFVQAAVAAATYLEGTGTAGTLTTTAIALADGTLRTMMLTKMKTAALVLLAVTILALGAGNVAVKVAFAQPPAAPEAALPSVSAEADPPKPQQAARPEPDENKTPDPKRRTDPLPAKAFAQMQAYPFLCPEQRQPSFTARDGDRMRTLLFSPDGKRIAFVEWKNDERTGWASTFHLQEVATGKDIWTLAGGPFHCIAFSPDGKLLAGNGHSDVYLFDATTGKPLQTFTPTLKDVVDLKNERERISTLNMGSFAFSPDGKKLAAESHISRHFGSDIAPGCITPLFNVWEVATGKVLLQKKGKVDAFFHIVGWDSEPRAVKSLGQKNIHHWKETVVEEVGMGEGSHVPSSSQAQASSPDEKTVATLGPNGTITLSIGARDVVLQLPSKHDEVSSLALSPDGRSLASGGREGRVYLWEVATGKVRWEVVDGKNRDLFKGREQEQGRQGWIRSVFFSPDGRMLVTDGESRNRSGHGIYVTFMWKLTGEKNPDRAPPLSAKELENLWADLGDADAGIAYRAIVSLTAAPEQAATYLSSQVRLLADPLERVARLLADLDADEFEVREKASAELAKMGDGVQPILRQALRRQLGPEVRQRLNQLLEQIRTGDAANFGGDLLRGVRTVEVLETVGTTEARAVLKVLAKGRPSTLLTEEAEVALKRLAKE